MAETHMSRAFPDRVEVRGHDPLVPIGPEPPGRAPAQHEHDDTAIG